MEETFVIPKRYRLDYEFSGFKNIFGEWINGNDFKALAQSKIATLIFIKTQHIDTVMKSKNLRIIMWTFRLSSGNRAWDDEKMLELYQLVPLYPHTEHIIFWCLYNGWLTTVKFIYYNTDGMVKINITELIKRSSCSGYYKKLFLRLLCHKWGDCVKFLLDENLYDIKDLYVYIDIKWPGDDSKIAKIINGMIACGIDIKLFGFKFYYDFSDHILDLYMGHREDPAYYIIDNMSADYSIFEGAIKYKMHNCLQVIKWPIITTVIIDSYLISCRVPCCNKVLIKLCRVYITIYKALPIPLESKIALVDSHITQGLIRRNLLSQLLSEI